jgi:hypothetical protein
MLPHLWCLHPHEGERQQWISARNKLKLHVEVGSVSAVLAFLSLRAQRKAALFIKHLDDLPAANL